MNIENRRYFPKVFIGLNILFINQILAGEMTDLTFSSATDPEIFQTISELRPDLEITTPDLTDSLNLIGHTLNSIDSNSKSTPEQLKSMKNFSKSVYETLKAMRTITDVKFESSEKKD